jgi:hypothetical protein
MSTALAFVADIAMTLLGGELKRKERLSARLGDVLSYLYLSSSAVRYFSVHEQSQSDLPFISWALQCCLFNIQNAFEEFCDNFPKPWLGKLLKRVIFPWGRSYKMPQDKLGQRVAEEMMKPSALRDRLTQYCYLGKNEDDGIYLLENAFIKLIASEPVRSKLQSAIRSGRVPRQGTLEEQLETALKAGILIQEEIQLLRDAQTLCEAAIQVDEFEFPLSSRAKMRNRERIAS